MSMDLINEAFRLAMIGRKYDLNQEAQARLWFCLGWIALERHELRMPFLVGEHGSITVSRLPQS